MNHVDNVLERAKKSLTAGLADAVSRKNYHAEKLEECNSEIEVIERKLNDVLVEIDKRGVK